MTKQNNIIDLELGKTLVGSKVAAKKMLAMLVAVLPQERKAIKDSLEKKDLIRFLSLVHKLHGGTCYCGVPRLKQAAFDLEVALKTAKNISAIKKAHAYLDKEIAALLRAYKKLIS